MAFASPLPHAPNSPPIDYRPDANGNPPVEPIEPIYGQSGGGNVADSIYEFDHQVGRLVQALTDPNQDGDTSDSILQNTLIVVTSDNGGRPQEKYGKIDGYDSTGALKGFKGEMYEGGHRVPFVAKWGDDTIAGSTIPPGVINNNLIAAHDWVGAFYSIVGAKKPIDQAMDTIDLLPVLKGESKVSPRDFMLHQSKPDEMVSAFYGIRQGNYVLHIDPTDRDDKTTWNDDAKLKPVGLYNLKNDLAQEHNLVDNRKQRKRIQEMLNLFKQHNDPDDDPI